MEFQSVEAVEYGMDQDREQVQMGLYSTSNASEAHQMERHDETDEILPSLDP
jgi:hypothetical protein